MARKAFATIVADPPWPYRQTDPTGSRQPKNDGELDAGVSALRRYQTMTVEQIAALSVPSRKNAHLYLWFTNAFAEEAHQVAKSWGFKPKTILTWVKLKADGSPSMKTGYYFRGATEHVLFAVRGSLKLQTKRAIPTALLLPRLGHSIKPDPFYDLVIECSPGPRLEMFARTERTGFVAWGDEVATGMELVANG